MTRKTLKQSIRAAISALAASCMIAQLLPAAYAEQDTITADYIDNVQFFTNEKEITVEVGFEDDLYDARTRLSLSLADIEDNTVADQKSCEYVNDNRLRYTLECRDGVSVETDSETYELKFDYSGSNTFENYIYNMNISPSDKEKIIKHRITDRNTAKAEFYIANYDENTSYYMTLGDDDTKYEAVPSGDHWVAVSFGYENNSVYNGESYKVSLLNGEDQILSDYRFYIYDENRSDKLYLSIDSCDNYVSGLTDSISIYIYKYNNSIFSSEDIDKTQAYMVNSTTMERVGEADSLTLSPDMRSIRGSIKLTKKLEDGEKYYIVADNGNDTVYRTVFSSSDAKFGYLEYKYNDRYMGEEIENRSRLTYEIGYINIDKASAFNAVILDSEGKEAAVLEPSSVKISDYGYNGYIDFTMKRTADRIRQDEAYTMLLYYNDKLIRSHELEYSGYNARNYDLYCDTYLADGDLYVSVDTYALEEASSEPYTYTLFNDATGEEITGEYYGKTGYSNIIKLPYDGDADEFESEGWYLKAENADAKLRSSIIDYVYTVRLPYAVSSHSGNGQCILYFIGLDPEKDYDVFLKNNDNDEVTEAEEVVTENEMLIPLSGDDPNNYVVFIEENGNFVYYRSFGSNNSSEKYYYPEKLYQNERMAVLYLPADDYSEYKTADSAEALESAEYMPMRSSITYVIPEGDGEKYVYARFKTPEGTESEIMPLKLYYDTTAPEISISDISDEYLLDEDNDLRIDAAVTSSESGWLCYEFYDNKGRMIGYTCRTDINEGENNVSLHSYDSKTADISKVVLYAEDNAENRSEKYSFDISVKEQYCKYQLGNDDYLLFNKISGKIEEMRISSYPEYIAVPGEIDGVPVTAIEGWDSDIRRIRIPASVTEMNDYWNMRNSTLLVEEGSYAHQFAETNEINYELLTVNEGIELVDSTGTSAESYSSGEGGIKSVRIKLSDEQSAKAENIDLYIGQYDDNGRLTAVQKSENIASENEYPLLSENETTNIKIFMWDTGYKPIDDAYISK